MAGGKRKIISYHGQQARKDVDAATVREQLDYDPETGKFTRKVPGTKPISEKPNGSGYLRIRIDGVSYKAHRIAWLHYYGRWPSDCIDHINGVRTDNRIANLRDVPHRGNQRNQKVRRDSQTGYKGVSRHPYNGRYTARIKDANGQQRHIGIFDTAEEAAEAYRKEHIAEFGPDARMRD